MDDCYTISISPVQDRDYGERAISALWKGYRRDNVPESLRDQPGDPDIVECKDKQYVVLVGRGGILAVYRIRPQGILKRIKRIPAGIVKLYSND